VLLRFVIERRNEDSQELAGLFVAADWIRDHEAAPAQELERLSEIRAWFDKRLPKPSRLRVSRRPWRKNKAISWFKSDARRHISRAREMAAIIAAHGFTVREIRTSRPGYVVYEDRFQVVAEPFADTER